MRHPVLSGVTERGDRLAADATGVVLELSGAATDETLRATADGSVDSVVLRHALCSVPDVARTLAEVDRVLAKGGRVFALEHTRAPGLFGRMQDAWSPAWRHAPGGAGCYPNRDPLDALRQAGFAVTDCNRFSTRGIPILSKYVAAVAIRKERPSPKEDEQQ